LKRIASKNTVIQFSSLLFSNYSLVVISFIISILMTETMSETDFGYYRYALTIITMCVSLINFGYHYSSARLIAVKEENEGQAIMSVTTIVMFVISVGFSLVALLILYIINLKITPVDTVAFWAVSLVFALLLQQMFKTILKGNNRINDIIIQTSLPSVIILITYLIIWINDYKLDFKTALTVYGATHIVIHCITWIRLKLYIPVNFIEVFKVLINENKTNGFQLYKGAIAGVFIADLLTVIVGATVDKALFGMYSLALSLSAPITTIPHTMATIKYKENANSQKLQTKNIVFTVMISIIGLIVLNIGVNVLFPVFYSDRYNGALDYLLICSFTFLVHGFGDYFNQFCAAHGLGKNLKFGAYFTGGTQLIFTIFLTPIWGLWGLIIAKFISSTVYFCCMFVNYVRFTSRTTPKEVAE